MVESLVLFLLVHLVNFGQQSLAVRDEIPLHIFDITARVDCYYLLSRSLLVNDT